MLAATRTESVGESDKVLFIDTVEDRPESLLDDFVFQGSYPQRPLSPIFLSYVGSPRRLRSVSAPVDSLMQRHQLFLQTLTVLPPRHFVHTGSCIALKRKVARPQQINCDMMQQRRKSAALILSCCFPHTVQSNRHTGPTLRSECGRLFGVLLGWSPSLQTLVPR